MRKRRGRERIQTSVADVAGRGNVFLPEVAQAITTLVLPGPVEPRRVALELAFFSEGIDPDIWLDGWDLSVSIAQNRANTEEAKEIWRDGGGAVPMHVVQAEDDIVSPPELDSALLKRDSLDRVTVSVIQNAALALLPEQPAAVAKAVLEFLGR